MSRNELFIFRTLGRKRAELLKPLAEENRKAGLKKGDKLPVCPELDKREPIDTIGEIARRTPEAVGGGEQERGNGQGSIKKPEKPRGTVKSKIRQNCQTHRPLACVLDTRGDRGAGGDALLPEMADLPKLTKPSQAAASHATDFDPPVFPRKPHDSGSFRDEVAFLRADPYQTIGWTTGTLIFGLVGLLVELLFFGL